MRQTIEREQLIVRSDFYLPRQHRLIDELVSRRNDMQSVLGIQFSNEPVHVYLFADENKFRSYLNEHFPELPDRRAFFVKTDVQLNVFAFWGNRVGEDLRHEVAHGYLHSSIPNIPLWMDEGIAEYFEVPRGQGGLNRVHIEHLASELQAGTWQPDLERLESLSQPASMGNREYAESWLWMHFLLNDSYQSRELLRSRLIELRQSGSAESLSSLLPGVIDNADECLVNYLGGLASTLKSGN